jgi:hypothetical protein
LLFPKKQARSDVKALEPEALPVRLDERLAVGVLLACVCVFVCVFGQEKESEAREV